MRFFAGDADASGLAAGAGEASAFLVRFFVGEADASGLAAAAGDVSAFLWLRFFAGEADASGLAFGDGVGLCAPAREAHAKIITDASRTRFGVMKRRLGAWSDIRQR